MCETGKRVKFIYAGLAEELMIILKKERKENHIFKDRINLTIKTEKSTS